MLSDISLALVPKFSPASLASYVSKLNLSANVSLV